MSAAIASASTVASTVAGIGSSASAQPAAALDAVPVPRPVASTVASVQPAAALDAVPVPRPAASTVAGIGSSASAQPAAGPITFGADEVELDPSSRSLEAAGHVRVDDPPFHFTSEGLRLERTPLGLVLSGSGELAFCLCLGTPLALQFSGAEIAMPADVVLRNPVLKVFGIPVAWLPAVWLRSPGRAGVLPAEIAWRGADGFFAGTGVHVPWRSGDTESGVDLRAGGYVDGGLAVDALLRTPETTTHVLWDRLHDSDGVTLGLRGALPGDAAAKVQAAPAVVWDVDALRGARALQATTDVGAAALGFDRAEGDAEWRFGGWTFASGVRTIAVRGTAASDVGAWGPSVTIDRSDAIASAGAYDVGLEGGQIDRARVVGTTAPSGSGATSFARGETNVLVGARIGALGSALALRAFGDVAGNGVAIGADGAAQARASIALPLARQFASADVADPWVHLTEPRVEIAALYAGGSGVPAIPVGRGMLAPSGGASVGAVGWSNTLGRRGARGGLDVDVDGGAVVGARGVLPVARVRASAGGPYVAFRADAARVFAPAAEVDGGGGIVVAGARIGAASGLHVSANLAERDGTDPVIARALEDPPYEAASGFLATTGWTGGARAGVPLGPRVTARAGADVDLDARRLVAATSAVELHDPCRCVVVRATGAHRIGRPGVDVWVTVELPVSAR